VISKEIENAGIPTALITVLVPTAQLMGAHRIIPGLSIAHPLGNPFIPESTEKKTRRQIVMTALESLRVRVLDSEVFQWQNRFSG
jgi:betaine reductase